MAKALIGAIGRGIVVAALFGPLFATGTALAQAPAGNAAPVLPDPLTPEAVREAVSRLSEADVRALLIEQLDRAGQTADPTGTDSMTGAMTSVETDLATLRDRIGALLAAVGDLPDLLPFVTGRLRDGTDAWQPMRAAGALALMLLAGFALGALVRRGAPAPTDEVSTESDGSGRAMHGLVVDLVALGAFGLGGLAVFFLLDHGHRPTRLVVLTYFVATLVFKATTTVSRWILSPDRPALRLLPVGDTAARELQRLTALVTAVLSFGLFTTAMLGALGPAGLVDEFLTAATGTLATAILLAAVWRSRPDVVGVIRGDGGDSFRRITADLWPLLATAYLLIVFVLAMARLIGGMSGTHGGVGIASLLLVPATGWLLVAGRRWIDRRYGFPEDVGPEQRRSHRAAVRILRAGVLFGALFLFLHLWGFEVLDVARRGVGDRVASALFEVGLTLALAYLAWNVLTTWIDRRLAQEQGPHGEVVGDETGQCGVSRLGTLLLLLRRFLFIVLLVMVAMIVLASLGVNIGPLLAGAGVVGLAVGFGAQTLVRDIVSGIFFLLDDAFRVGEYIDLGTVKGTVEATNIRSLRLRHHRGAVHTIPYGEISYITNYSRDWAIIVLEFPVPFDTDLGKVKKIFKKIGEELKADPEMGPHLLMPVKSQGVIRIEPHALIVRGKFMARPGEQFLIRREVYQRVQHAFADAGIPFARPQVSVHVPEDAKPDEVAQAAAAAFGSGSGAKAADHAA